MDTELAAACTLLQAEFPDTPRSVLESALREVDLDIPAARRKLLELQMDHKGKGDSLRRTGSVQSPTSPDGGSWFSSTAWNQGIRDLGLESFGAQLSLLGRQVANSIHSFLPPDLNPFAVDEDDYDEEDLAAVAAAKAKLEERERESKALAASARKLNARRGVQRTGSTSRFTSQDEEAEEEEEEDTDKLN